MNKVLQLILIWEREQRLFEVSYGNSHLRATWRGIHSWSTVACPDHPSGITPSGDCFWWCYRRCHRPTSSSILHWSLHSNDIHCFLHIHCHGTTHTVLLPLWPHQGYFPSSCLPLWYSRHCYRNCTDCCCSIVSIDSSHKTCVNFHTWRLEFDWPMIYIYNFGPWLLVDRVAYLD